jgi:phosphatidylserine/phosphatidylglycerophosphate/cardiolipin synthase-like enzyme
LLEAALIEAVADAARHEDPEVLLALAAGIDAGQIPLNATAGALQSRLGMPTRRLDRIRQVLRNAESGDGLPSALRVAVETARVVRSDAPEVEVAATSPQRGGRARTTGGVARDVVGGASETLLVVGYSVTADARLAGLAAKTLAAMGAAATRGVRVTAVLHRNEANRAAMMRAWPTCAPRPRLFTWPERPDDEMASMHAKVLVADAHDALVTSANLTYHGFVGNVEMGVRVIGKPAREVASVFEELIREGEFVDWSS